MADKPNKIRRRIALTMVFAVCAIAFAGFAAEMLVRSQALGLTLPVRATYAALTIAGITMFGACLEAALAGLKRPRRGDDVDISA